MNLLYSRIARLKPHQRPAVDVLCFLILMGVALLAGCKKNRDQIRAGKVVGGSMAPSFLGQHLFFECRGCHSTVSTDLEQSNQREHLICPYCGTLTERNSCAKRPADAVEIAIGSPIERWDVVAFQVPGLDESGIKRVVGLPGEKIEIRDGNIFADGRLLQKPIAAQRQMRILIHDSARTDLESPRWFPVNPDQSFEFNQEGSFQFGDLADEEGGIGWVEYRHQRCYSRRTDRVPESDLVPIEDVYGYNQSIARDLNPVSDLIIELEVVPASKRQVCWLISHRFGEFVFTVDFDKRRLRVSNSGRPETIVEMDESSLALPVMRIECSCFDHQFLVLVNGKTVSQFPIEQPRQERADTEIRSTRLQVGSRGSLTINRIRIWRDLHYLAADGMPGSTQLFNTTTDGYVLLGDNIPISVDSRHWETATVSGQQIIGRILQKTE